MVANFDADKLLRRLVLYTSLKSVQILISLLKSYFIDHIVISPGTRALPLVHSVEQDSFFKCFSITDERSAGFFALGLIQKLNKPVAVCCTSGTAVTNILSATSEAKYQRLPLLVLTAERNLYMLDQYPDQMVPTNDFYKVICKQSVVLPNVRDETDEWRCMLSTNQALSELNHNTPGPVNIIFQVDEADVFNFKSPKVPKIKRIKRITTHCSDDVWKEKVETLKDKRKILISCGQHSPFKKEVLFAIKEFSKKYSSVFICDNISNLHIENSLNPNSVLSFSAEDNLNNYLPDILITFGGHSINKLSKLMKFSDDSVEHWLINKDGDFIDSYKKLTCVFECDPYSFFQYFARAGTETANKNNYIDPWREFSSQIPVPQFGYSDIYSVQKLFRHIPKDSVLHLANSLSVRYSQFFKLDESIKVYCNRGQNGIDGSLSTFIGNSVLESKLCFLLIGDLSFFYDMTGIWNRYLGSNVRILLNNNFGGMLFNSSVYWSPYSRVNDFVAAEHKTSAKGWCESCGFQYLSAKCESEFEESLQIFLSDKSNSPIIFEVFTDKKNNDAIFLEFMKKNREITPKRVVNYLMKKVKLGS